MCSREPQLEPLDERNARERVARLRALVHAGERAPVEVQLAIDSLQQECYAACARAEARMRMAMRAQANLARNRQRLRHESAVWRKMRDGATRAVAEQALRVEQGYMREALASLDLTQLDSLREAIHTAQRAGNADGLELSIDAIERVRDALARLVILYQEG